MKDKIKWLFLLGVSIWLLSGCGETVQEASGTVETAAVENYVEKETASLEDFRLRDKESVYEDDDEGSVVTMYLTVREGNSAENTNHTWTEVNTYSKYWYEENHIPQYAVEGILQVDALILRAMMLLIRNGGAEEACSLCRGEGETVCMLGWLQW